MGKPELTSLHKAILEVMYIIDKSGVAPKGMTDKQIKKAYEAYRFILLEKYGIEL